jgi:hypothetical protein
MATLLVIPRRSTKPALSPLWAELEERAEAGAPGGESTTPPEGGPTT